MKKKFLKLFSVAVALIMLIGVFAACTENNQGIDASEQGNNNKDNSNTAMDAFELYEKIDDAMEGASSYRMDGILKMKLYMSAYDMSVDASGTMLNMVSGIGTDDFCEVNSQTTTSKMTFMGTTETMTEKSMDGYINGKMFVMNDYGDSTAVPQKMYSEMTVREYLEYADDDSSSDMDFDIDREHCSNGECTFDSEAREWTAVYSGFTKEAIDDIGFDFADMGGMLDGEYETSDIKITVVAGENFTFKKLSMKCIFKYVGTGTEDISKAPQMTMDATFSGINNTKCEQTIDFATYNKVDDLGVLEVAKDAIEDRLEAKSGKFTAEWSIVAEDGMNGEKYQYDYSQKSGSLEYTLKYSDYEGMQLNIAYANGKAKATYIVPSASSQTFDSTDEAEYESIAALIDDGKFKKSDITDIETVNAAEGKYKFIVGNVDADLIEDLGLVQNPSLMNCSQYFELTIKDGVLMSYKFVLTAMDAQGNTGTYTSSCKF